MVKKPRLTPTFKQKLFAHEYVKNRGNGVKSALAVYDTDYIGAKNISTQNLDKPAVQNEINKLLKKNGLTLDSSTEYLKKYIDKSIESKPSFSVGADLLKFVFKLYNAIPINKSMNLSYSKVERLPVEDFKKIQELLTKLNDNTTKILNDLHK
jgi:hypothetical protein